jgi:hypothetical protein
MKYAFAAVALAAVARAQTLADIPECALPCLDKSIADNTDCKTTDLACVCENFDAVQGDATACVLKECGSDVAISMFSPTLFCISGTIYTRTHALTCHPDEVLPAAEKLCENPPAAGGEETTSAAPAEPTSAAEETKPAETAPAEETSAYAPPAETSVEPTPVPLPSPTDVVEPPTSEEPEVTPVPTAAAAPVGYMGGLAMALLGALAL